MSAAYHEPAYEGFTTSFFDLLCASGTVSPLIVGFFVAVTALVVTVKVPDVAPCGIVIDGVGCATDGMLLDSVTTTSPGAASHSSDTVPLTELPPTIVAGVSVMLPTPIGWTSVGAFKV